MKSLSRVWLLATPWTTAYQAPPSMGFSKQEYWSGVPLPSRWGSNGNSDRLYFGDSKITADGDYSHEIKRRLLLGRKVMTNLDSILKSRHYFANKDPSSQSYGFSSSHVWMWELDYKESWVPKNRCFWTIVGEGPWESLGQQGDPTSPS